MTDPLLCTIHRVNSNKSHTHIPEIYNAEKNFHGRTTKGEQAKNFRPTYFTFLYRTKS